MLNIKQFALRCLYLSITLAAINVATAPASAQSVIIINRDGVDQRHTGDRSHHGHKFHNYKAANQNRRITPRGYQRKPYVRQNVVNPTRVYRSVNYRTNTTKTANPVTTQTPYGSSYPFPGVQRSVFNPTQTYPNVNYPTNRNPAADEPAPPNYSWRRSVFKAQPREIVTRPRRQFGVRNTR